MKKIILLILVLLSPVNVFAENIKITVKGMVCSFCAQGIKKNFGKLPEVEDVKPDLGKQLVEVITKSKQTLSDEKIKEIITDAGYEVVQIERDNK